MQQSLPIDAAFTTEQAADLAVFTLRNSCGLRIEIATDHEELPEIAEVWRQGETLPVCFLKPQADGTVEVRDPAVHDGNEHMASLGAALAHVVEIEKGG